ncbi:MAG: methyltransferase domain-containing protein [Nitrospiraceae bacterium]|nr:methyltransferase domain-containing protein [Nitrospiraceae bacterium]
MTSILQCPVCRELLLLSADGYQCSKNHTFDAARQGYVNFLLAHKKHSKEPGDSPEMIRSRRRFLDLGLYNRVSDNVNEAIAGALRGPETEGAFTILDAGCGEGFYIKRLKEFLLRGLGSRTLDYYGVDISKFAVRQATQRDKTMNWFVASINDLPFAASSFDIVLNIFSPANVAEFSRILKETGSLVIVSPGPRHLNGLREIIYPIAREHAAPDIAEQAGGLLALSTTTRVNYRIELKSSAEVMDLLAMTPYYWNIDLGTKSKVEALDQLATDVDVEIRVFRKTSR